MTSANFDEWLRTGTVRRETVDIYFDQEAVQDCLDIAAEIEALDSRPKTINEASGAVALQERWDEANARLEASKATFTLMPLSRDVVLPIFEQFPLPKPPANPAHEWQGKGEPTTDAERKHREALEAKFQAAREKFAAEYEAAEAERVAQLLSASIVSVERGGETVDHLTVEQIKQLRDAPYGVARVNRLWKAYEAVHQEVTEIERPTLPGNFGSDRA